MAGTSVSGSSDGGSKFQQRMQYAAKLIWGDNSSSNSNNNKGFWPVNSWMSSNNGMPIFPNFGNCSGMTSSPNFGGFGGMSGMPQGKMSVGSFAYSLDWINNSAMPDQWKKGWANVFAQGWMQQNGCQQSGGADDKLKMLEQLFGSDVMQLAQALKNVNSGDNGTSTALPYMQLAQIAPYLEQLASLQQLSGSDQTSLQSSNQLSANEKDWGKVFEAMDQRNGNGNVDWKEYLNYFIQDKEKQLGKTFMDTNSPEYKKYYQEALNMFNAMATPDGTNGTRVITKENFGRMMAYFDKMDGSKDGNIDAEIYNRSIAQIKEYGDDAIISNGQTLRELMG